MERKQKEIYLENVRHVTNERPYSIHKSGFSTRNKSALYLHWHPDFEFFYLEEGELDFYIEEKRCHVNEGEAVFIPPNLLHRAVCTSAAGGIFRALVFSPDFIASPMSMAQFQKYVQPVLYNNVNFALHLQNSSPWQREVLRDLARIFDRTQEAGEAGDNGLLVCGLVLVIWQNLFQSHISKVAVSCPQEKLERQLQEPVRYIREHFSEDITLDMLARLAHMSQGQFCRSFKQLTGSTPFAYLKKYRVMHSCAYLAGSDKLISEICTLCGFNNISYYNREFLKTMKVTPSSYRQQCRSGKERENLVISRKEEDKLI